jgi:hypothetical protein
MHLRGVVSAAAWLAVVGLGSDGGQALADGDLLARGVHLRWGLRPDLGFPVGGYDVWRRRHREAEWVCLRPDDGLLPPPGGVTEWHALGYAFELDPGVVHFDGHACAPTGAVYLPGQRSLEVRAPRPMVAIRATGTGPPPQLEVFATNVDERPLVAATRAEPQDGGWTATVWADGAVGCRLSGADMRICTVCFGLGQPSGGWGRLTDRPVLLPVVAPGSANEPANLQGAAATRAVAARRLSDTLDKQLREELATGFAADGPGELLEGLVRDGRAALVPAQATASARAQTPPRLGLPTAQLLALAALDPNVSRMLGLFWHDPVQTGSYDYKVVAHHGDARFPSRLVRFDDVPVGPLGTGTFVHDGLTFVGTAGLEVLAPRPGSSAALRVQAPRVGTSAGLRLDPPTPAVTLRLRGSPVVPLAAWRGGRQVDSAAAFLGAATLEDADGIDAVTWSIGPVDVVEVELFEAVGVVGDLIAYVWQLAPVAPPPVHALALSDAGAAAEPARLNPDGTVDEATGVVGLDWDDPTAVHDACRPVRVHVGRASARDASTFDVCNGDRPAPAFSETGAPSRAGPDVPQRWVERGLPSRTFAWSVRGIDGFGRLGPWSEPRELRAPTGTIPPAPDGVVAAYLDSEDPYLSAEQRALVDRDGPGLVVEWTWTAERRLAAPGVEPHGEFRVYVRHGDPNVLEGVVRSVTDLGDRSRLATDCAVPGARRGLAGERLRVGQNSFAVLDNAAGDHAWFEVAHLTAPTARPTTGPFTVYLSESSAVRTDLTRSRSWDASVHAEPVGSLPRTAARIVAVDAPGGTATVTLDRPLAGAGAQPGRLVAAGIAFRVLEQASGSPQVVVAAAVLSDGATALPGVGEPCTVWDGARCQVWLPGAGATPSVQQRLALTLVGVSTCDLDAVVLHEPLPPHRRAATADRQAGLEGPVSGVVRVTAPHRLSPAPVSVTLPPEDDGDVPAARSGPADWFGHARYALAFTPVTGATGYRVARAAVAALFDRDRAARQGGVAPYDDGPFDDGGASEAWLAAHHPELDVDDLTVDLETRADAGAIIAAWRDWSAWFYPSKLNREVMALAELPCNEEVFRPAHEGAISRPPFIDELDGRGLGRFVFRVRSVDASGNASAWSAAFPLVEIQDVTAPATPVLLALRAGENRITAEWLTGTEPDLAEYRVWRAETPEGLADVRRLAPQAALSVAPGSRQSYADEPLPGGRAFAYRVAAVDAAGNVSVATPPAVAVAVDTRPPNPPAWVDAAWTGRGVRLEWRADEELLACVLQRRPMGGGVWQAVSPSLEATMPPYDFRFLDRTAADGFAYEYRVLATDAAGNPALEFTIQPVWLP